MMEITRRSILQSTAAVLGASPILMAGKRTDMREVGESNIITVAADPEWYMHCAGVATVGDELVCTYRKSDEHTASRVMQWCARSGDGGRTWGDGRMITDSSWESDKACWVAPQLTKFKDGRLVLIADRGVKKWKQDWPMLSHWQKPDRGMSNHLFFSSDRGRTWNGPRKIDDIGGEPGYIVELASGSWMFTRTESKPTNAVKVPTMPWGPIYYQNTAVFSDDKGATWSRTSLIADDPLYGDCEIGVVELAPGRLLAVSRVGDGGGRYGQPSRFIYSSDSGKTWSKPVLSPMYGHRPIIRLLRSGKLLVSYRNAWGTPASYAFRFDPAETFSYQPNSMIWDEGCCQLHDGVLEIRSGEGREKAVEFGLYPVEDNDSAVELEAELMVKEADANGCMISAGAWLRFTPTRVMLADRPADGFDIDASQWHKYRIINTGRRVTVHVDGKQRLDASTEGIFVRYVRFGNRTASGAAAGNTDVKAQTALPANARPKPLTGMFYTANACQSFWRSVAVKVNNRRDHSVEWKWSARQGYPDQFRRDRMIRLERCGSFAVGDCGYSGWTQTPGGSIVVTDYSIGNPPARRPRLRAYLLEEADFG